MLIPAWQPDARLVPLVEALLGAGIGCVLLVDDGSDARCAGLFRALSTHRGVIILTHAVNLGKGRALKTGFNFLLTHPGGFAGVVTADADGQHTAEDIVHVAERLLQTGERTVLGVRGFTGEVPLRSRAGNLFTRRLFAFLTGSYVSDTQTGLRGLPLHSLPDLLALEGERYEYEMTMLAHLCRTGPAPVEVPIATVYLDGNRTSHFDPLRDSMRIYFVLLRFYASSLLAAGLDLLLFAICFALSGAVLLSVVVGRFSSLVNFWINRRFVFQSQVPLPRSLWRYYLLAVALGAASYQSIVALHRYAHWPVLLAKIAIDVVLSLLSFAVQRTLVFRRGEVL